MHKQNILIGAIHFNLMHIFTDSSVEKKMVDFQQKPKLISLHRSLWSFKIYRKLIKYSKWRSHLLIRTPFSDFCIAKTFLFYVRF